MSETVGKTVCDLCGVDIPAASLRAGTAYTRWGPACPGCRLFYQQVALRKLAIANGGEAQTSPDEESVHLVVEPVHMPQGAEPVTAGDCRMIWIGTTDVSSPMPPARIALRPVDPSLARWLSYLINEADHAVVRARRLRKSA